jgi:hypothetical protein
MDGSVCASHPKNKSPHPADQSPMRASAYSQGASYFTAAFKALPATNFGTVFALILISAPV